MSDSYQRVEANQNATRSIEQFWPMINRYTYKFHQRAVGLGSPLDYDDVRQELCLTFTKCKASYDETKGASFMNFVISAWFNEMNRIFRKDQRNREEGLTLHAVQGGDDEESYNLFDVVDSGWATPEQNLEALSSIEFTLNGLSDQARVLVETLLNPPESVCEQYDLRECGVDQRRADESGTLRHVKQLNLNFLFKLFDIPADVARRLQREIEQKTTVAFGL